MPARLPTAKASAVAATIAWPMKLLSNLIAWPAPGSPTWKTFSAQHLSTGSILAKVAWVAPTMMFKRPASASTGERASGASTNTTPLLCASSRKWVVEWGSLVEQSTMIKPALGLLNKPSGPATTASTCGEPVTQIKTMSQLAPKAAALSAKVAPASSKSFTRSRCLCTVIANFWPLAIKFLAMPWPIRPDAPMYPTVISVSLVN